MRKFFKNKKITISLLCALCLILFVYIFFQNYSLSLVSVLERNRKYTNDSLRKVNMVVSTEKLYDNTFYTLYLSDEKLNCTIFSKKSFLYNFESLKVGVNYINNDMVDEYDIDVLPFSKGYIYFGVIYNQSVKNIKLDNQPMNILKKDGITFVYLISDKTVLYSEESTIR